MENQEIEEVLKATDAIRTFLEIALDSEKTTDEKTVALLSAVDKLKELESESDNKDDLILELQKKIEEITKTNQELIKRELLREEDKKATSELTDDIINIWDEV